MIEQVFVNLLENAAKYTEPQSSIEIRASISDSFALVAVADRGPGLPPGEEQRVFEKFFRGQRTKNIYGVGLGLAICRAIVEAHGGKIWAENRSDGGAIFFFTLPINGQPPEMEEELDEHIAPMDV
jgi:two-component system sensor histidine kinase KdpD